MKSNHKSFKGILQRRAFSRASIVLRDVRAIFCGLLCFTPLGAMFAQVSAPVFNPSSEISATGPIDVVVTCTGTGVSIYYTTNGQNPTQADTPIANSGTIPIYQNMTLKATAYTVSGSSAVTSGTYAVTGLVSCGTYHIAALRYDGMAFAWGEQTSGRLGNGVLTSGTVPAPTSLMKTGSAAFTNAVQVAAGENHTLLLDTSGTVWVTGANSVGQLGTGTSGTTTNLALAVGLSSGTSGLLVSQVEAGSEFSLALTTMASGTGKVLSWGEGAQGRLGNNSTSDRSSPGYVLKAASGSPPLDNIIEISAGKNFGAALHSDGTIYTWGFGGSGQLGQGDTANNDRAAQVREYFSLVNTPVITGMVAVSAGEDHMLAIRNTGTFSNSLYAWGEQQYGVLGNGETSSQAKKYAFRVQKEGGGYLDDIVQIDAGAKISLALHASGTVYAFGRNNMGAVGDETTTNRSLAKAINVSGTVPVVWISAGGDGTGFCAALDRDGRLYTWGDNTKAIQGTGTGSATPVTSPVLSGTSVAWTNQPPTGTLSISGEPYTAPATANLSVTGSDANGNINKVNFYQNSTLLISDTTSPYAHSVTSLASGTYTFGAKIFDAAGATFDTNTVPITVALPTVNVTGTPATILESSGSSATFRISRAAEENLTNPLSVNFTLTGTAINGGDYATVNPLTATIASGSTTAIVAISPINDAYVEGSENVLMTLTTSATSYSIQTGTATITITESQPGWIAKISGDNQMGAPSEFLTDPLVVEVSSGSGGTLLIGAPVLFTVASGSGVLSTTFGGTVTSGTLTVNTGTNGRAQAWYRQGSEVAVTSTITAQSGTSGLVSFTAETLAGLWSHWPFSEGTGTTAEEATGEGGDGTLINSPVWIASGTGGFDGQGAISFTGSNGYVTMGSPTGRTLDLGTGNFSLALWVKYTEVPGSGETRRIVGKGYNGWGAGYFIGLKNDGKLAAGLGATSGTQADALLFKTTGTFNDGEWHHVAVTIDRTNTKAQIYVDGESQALEKEAGTGGTVTADEISLAGLTALSASGTGAPFTVASFSGTAAFFKGEVDDVQVYRSALEEEEVQEIYNVDSDDNGLPDWWETKYLDGIGSDPEGHADSDGLNNLDEYLNGTLPGNPDTDGDDMPDGWEVNNGLDPVTDDAGGDLDGDGMLNYDEYLVGRNPNAGVVTDSGNLLGLKVYTQLE